MKKYQRTKSIEEQLTKISEKIQRKYFSELQPLPVILNSRLQRTRARILIPGIFPSPKIEIAEESYNLDLKTLKSIIKHEYIHYQLANDNNNKRYGHNLKFAKKARILNCSENGTKPKWIYKCKCNYFIERRKLGDTFCPNCLTKICGKKRG